MKDISKSLNAPSFSSGFRTALAPFERIRRRRAPRRLSRLSSSARFFQPRRMRAFRMRATLPPIFRKCFSRDFSCCKIKAPVCGNRKIIRGSGAARQNFIANFPASDENFNMRPDRDTVAGLPRRISPLSVEIFTSPESTMVRSFLSSAWSARSVILFLLP